MLSRVICQRSSILVNEYCQQLKDVPSVHFWTHFVHQEVQALDHGVTAVPRFPQLFQELHITFRNALFAVPILQLVKWQQKLLKQVLFLDDLHTSLCYVLYHPLDTLHQVDRPCVLLLWTFQWIYLLNSLQIAYCSQAKSVSWLESLLELVLNFRRLTNHWEVLDFLYWPSHALERCGCLLFRCFVDLVNSVSLCPHVFHVMC